MNINDYVSSGILEEYAAGLLDSHQSSQVEDMIRKHAEVRSEYEKIQKTLYLTVSANLRTPSSSVRDSILKKIDHQRYVRPVIESYLVQKNYSYKYLMAASVAFLLLSLGVNYFLWSKLNDARNEIAVMQDKQRIMTQDLEAVNSKLNQASRDMNIMKDRNYKVADMKGMERSPSSNVLAFWNPETGKVYVEVVDLPVPPKGMQYQLWALNNGKPVDAGMMNVVPNDRSLHEMKDMKDAQAFAITLEPEGGSVNPTMDQMYVLGNL